MMAAGSTEPFCREPKQVQTARYTGVISMLENDMDMVS